MKIIKLYWIQYISDIYVYLCNWCLNVEKYIIGFQCGKIGNSCKVWESDLGI